MLEKICEHEEKAALLREKILNEIKRYEEGLHWLEITDAVIEEWFAIIQLRKYVEYDGSFCMISMQANDEAVYYLNATDINIMLDKSYSVVGSFLSNVLRDMPSIWLYLNDKNFNNIISTFECIAYERRNKNG